MTIGGSSARDRAEFRHGDLEVRQDFEQEGLEGLVGAVEFVDEKHRRAAGIRLEGLQQRALDEIALREEVAFEGAAVDIAAGFGEADRHHLAGIVPFVDGRGDVETLVALQADEPAPEGGGQNLRDLGLADAGLPFEEERPPELEGEKEHRRQRPVGDVAGAGQEDEGVVDRAGQFSQRGASPKRAGRQRDGCAAGAAMRPLWVLPRRFPMAAAARTDASGRSHALQATMPYQSFVLAPARSRAASMRRSTTAPKAVAAIASMAARCRAIFRVRIAA